MYCLLRSTHLRLGLPSVVEERIISSLSLGSSTDEVLIDESKSDDRSEPSNIMDSSSQTDQDVIQDSKTDVSARVLVTSDQAVCQSESVSEKPESLINTPEEGGSNEESVNESREETMRTSRAESEDETSTESVVIADGGGDAEDLPTGPEGSTGQMLKVIVPKHLLPAIKQISLPSVLLSRCTSSEPVPLK